MENDVAKLYCPDERCQAANPLSHNFCGRCSTPLPKRYLWALGGLSSVNPGEILVDRYLVIDQSIVLDLKPGLSPQIPQLENLDPIKAYLRLIHYRLHIPQVYGIISLSESQSQREILLLEKPPLVVNSTYTEVHLCSQLTEAWGDASSIRQMNWLWQMGQLWQPFVNEKVGCSLLDPYLIRVEGGLVRLLRLDFDGQKTHTLADLGEFWQGQQLVKNAKPAIAQFLKEIIDGLIQGQINSSEQLIAVLDQGLLELETESSITIITQTDKGPQRQRNEDACYPPSGVMVTQPNQETVLAIVCDGIGGHEGGNIASNLAIQTIQEEVVREKIDPSTILNDLEQAVALANDKISERNDTEHRQGRQRMGTTVVMALPIAPAMYITHVGDSRAYWITRHNCHQITLDDDLASREVRLGYAVYRQALQHSGSGSLVQALGMSTSASLHPTSQRFIIDEDAVFLLTSDGLSDFDRVEDYWEREILPIITGDKKIEDAASQLIEIANTKNGHDNVTVALIHYQIKYREPDKILKADIQSIPASKTVDLKTRSANETSLREEQQTKIIPETKSWSIPKLPLQLLILLVVVLVAGVLGMWLKIQLKQSSTTSPTPTDIEQSSPVPAKLPSK